MATDIAFALGLVALLGSRVPSPLRVFLLTLAIVDDLGAILVIGVFYGEGLQSRYLLVAAGVAALVAVMRRLRVTYAPLYALAGVGLRVAVYESGVHATIAGVVLGLLTPARPLQTEVEAETMIDVLEDRRELSPEDIRVAAQAIRGSVSMCERLVDALHPWTSFVIVPVFALAYAGISLRGDPLGGSTPVFLGVAAGLVVGKCLGITGFAWLATRLRIARLPIGVRWPQMLAVATLAGIGFTVSLFITTIAFTEDGLADAAKVGILVASVVAAAGGSVLFALASGRAGQS